MSISLNLIILYGSLPMKISRHTLQNSMITELVG